MSTNVEPKSYTQDKAARIVYVWWGVGLSSLLILGALCWVAVRFLEVRDAVERCDSHRDLVAAEVKRLGGAEAPQGE
jgi:hypothetical protein